MPDALALISVLDQEWAEQLGDAELLAALSVRGNDQAFAILLDRHGPMVLGVCRRILGNDADAEDAFQATFLVLVRRGAGLRDPGQLRGWLHGVATRTAKAARRTRRRTRQPIEPLSEPAETASASTVEGREIYAVIDAEIAQLPVPYRDAAIHCLLYEQTQPEAAAQLGLPEGTLSSRLARARALLRHRLSRRGIGWSLGPMAVQASRELRAKTLTVFVQFRQAGDTALPAGVAGLSKGGWVIMQWTKWNIALGLAVLLGVTGWGVADWVAGPGSQKLQAQPDPPAEADPAVSEGADAEAPPKEALTYKGENYPTWVRTLRTELEPVKRAEAFVAIGAFGANGYGEEAARVILEVAEPYSKKLALKDHQTLLNFALSGLYQIGNPAAKPLRKLLHHPDKEIRLFALQAANQALSGETARDFLVAVLQAEDPKLRRQGLKVFFDASGRTYFGLLPSPNEAWGPAGGFVTAFGPAMKSLIPGQTEAVVRILTNAFDPTDDLLSDRLRRILAELVRAGEVSAASVIQPLLPFLQAKDLSGAAKRQVIRLFGDLRAAAAPAVPALIRLYRTGATDTRRAILLALGNIGPAAKEAIPTIEEATQVADLQVVAARALAQVRGKPAPKP